MISRRNILASLTLVAVMGCQKSDTVVSTDAPFAAAVSTGSPFSIPSGDDHPAAQSAFMAMARSQIPLPVLFPRTPTVWTTQSLSLDVLPGSPPPVRAVAAPAPAETIVVAEFKAPAARVAPTTTAAPPASAALPATAARPASAAPPATAAPPAPPPTTVPPAPVVPAVATVAGAPGAAADIAARTNAVRSGRGVAPLAREASLDSAAAAWANQLATSGVLRHSALPQQLLGKPWSTVGENVGFGASSTVIHDALVNSAGHLANIVGANFTRIGVGAATDANGRLWVVELFAG